MHEAHPIKRSRQLREGMRLSSVSSSCVLSRGRRALRSTLSNMVDRIKVMNYSLSKEQLLIDLHAQNRTIAAIYGTAINLSRTTYTADTCMYSVAPFLRATLLEY
jgi:hypothetical protein